MMNKKNLTIMAVMTLMFFGAAVFSFAENAIMLDELIEEASANNPRIKAQYHIWKAEEAKIRRVSSLPDPMASYGNFGEMLQTRVGPQEARYGFSQKVPFPGKLHLKAKATAKMAEKEREKYEAVKREIIKQVKFLYYDLYWVEKAIDIVQEEKTLMENMEFVARRRYETRKAPQQDVVKIQLAIAQLDEKISILNQQRESTQALLNSILSRDTKTKIKRIDEILLIPFTYELEQLTQMALETRHELLMAELDVESAQYEKSLAKLDYMPDFTFGVDFIEIGSGTTTRPDDGQDAWMATVAVNIPLWFWKQQANVKEKSELLNAAKYKNEDMKNTVGYEVQDIYFKIKSYSDIVLLYETGLIPEAQMNFDSAKTAYETGKVDFLNWLDAQKRVLQTRLAYEKAFVDYSKSVAFLERIVGRELY